MKAILDKCHLITSSSDKMSMSKNYNIKRSKSIKILGTKIDHKLNFTNHIDKICKEQDKESTFIELLEKDNSVSIHR